MKKQMLFIAIAIFTVFRVEAQSGAAINTTGISADPSAMFDISSTNAGILIPRMTEVQKAAISSPATGLMIYQTDGIKGFWYYDGTAWVQSIGVTGPTGPIGATGTTGTTGTTGSAGLLSTGSAAGNTPYWDGTQWVVNSSNIYNNGGSVGIGTYAPDASAVIDINSNSKGALIPRMTTTERNAIASPAEGLQIFNTTTKCFEYFAYGIWQTWHCATCPMPYDASAITGSASVCQGQSGVSYTVPLINNASTYIWSYSGTGATIYGTTHSVTIDFAANATSGILTVKGNNQCGNGIISPDFNITVSAFPIEPSASTHTPYSNEIIWNWGPVSGATGYKYNTSNNYSSAIDLGNNTSYTQTGLICNTSYTIYVWSYNLCGNSSAAILTQTTLACWSCGNSLPITHTAGNVAPVNKSVNYGTVLTNISGASKCWITQNLGASNQAGWSADDSEGSAGWYWQFNRQQGYKHDGSVRTPATTWISSINESSDWTSSNDPCTIELGAGWRIPTYTEWTNADGSPQNWANRSDTYNSVLLLHAAGRLDNGTLSARGTAGHYWSATQYSSTSGWPLYLTINYSGMDIINGSNKGAYGFSVRCIKD